MKTKAIVFIEIDGHQVPAGQIAIVEDGRLSRCEFSYGKRYLDRADAIAIDPVQLPLSGGPMIAPDGFSVFNGIRDAAPDAWGRRLIDRESLRQQGRPAMEAEFLLASQSKSRVGALSFGPDPSTIGPVMDFRIDDNLTDLGDLGDFQEMIDDFHVSEDLPARFSDFLSPGTDMGGARPKGTVTIDGSPHMIKFGLDTDRYNFAAVEAGCLDLCEMAQIEVCGRQIVEIAGRDALILSRFDRYENEAGFGRHHMISSLTLLGAHESDRGISSYADIYDGLRKFGDATTSGEDIFRRMVMNVLVGNTDDHYRNTALIHVGSGKYAMSPAYDVTPSLQAVGTRNLFFHLGRRGEGRVATLENAVAAGPCLGINTDHARSIVNDLSDMVGACWRDVLSRRGASGHDIAILENSFSEAGRHVREPDEPDDTWEP